MAKNKFLIAPFTSGLVKDLPVWQTPEDSFDELENAYVTRGVIKKRVGSKYIGTETTELLAQLKTRLRILVGVTDADGDISWDGVVSPTVGALPLPVGSVFKAGQMFSIGSDIFTVPEAAVAPATEPVTMLTNSTTASTYTYNTTNGQYVIEGSEKLKNLYWYPCEPVMGLTQYEADEINNHTTIAFDTRFAYQYSGTGWSRVGTQIYKGDNLDYFYSANVEGPTQSETGLFATNYNANAANSDPIYYTLDKITWTAFVPKIRTGGTANQNIVVTAKIIAPFDNRMCLFGTYEYEDKTIPLTYSYKYFKNRLRFSAIGNPLTIATGWLEPLQTGYIGGGYTDAPTEEEIISIQYVKDEMIVFFERSTYRLVRTLNDSQPFIWQKISSDLGSESTHSSIASESGAITIGTNGVHLCDGINVTRIDKKIPEEISKFLNVSDATKRMHGIKDYDREVFYWVASGQSKEDAENFTDKIICFNYENKSWALFDDSFTCFGYFEQSLGEIWEEDYQSWGDDSTDWNSGEALPSHRKIIAGNQHGFVVSLGTDNSNAPSLQISNVSGKILTINQHNLKDNSYVLIHNSGVPAQDIIRKIDSSTENTITIKDSDDNPFSVPDYKGGATISTVSRINIKSTAWNPYSKDGNNVYLSKIVFCVERSESGEIGVNYIPSGSNINITKESIITEVNLGSYNLEMYPFDLLPLESSQKYLWHAVYLQAEGNNVQINIKWSDAQMLNKSIVQSNFEIQGLILETSPSSSIG